MLDSPKVIEVDGIPCCIFPEEVDVFNVPRVRQAALGALTQNPRMMLDLLQTTFIDSSALALFVVLNKSYQIVIVTESDRFKRLLEITGLTHILTVVGTRKEAVTLLE